MDMFQENDVPNDVTTVATGQKPNITATDVIFIFIN